MGGRPAPPSDRAGNWPDDSAALNPRGSPAIRFDPDTIRTPPPSGRRGRCRSCGDAAIRTCPAMDVSFGIALRQMTGFVGSPMRLVGLDRGMPDVGTSCRRREGLAATSPHRASPGPAHLPIDRAGLKAGAEGVGTHASRAGQGHAFGARPASESMRRRRTSVRSRVSLAIATGPKEPVDGSPIGDASMPSGPLGQRSPDEAIGSATADGACDARKCHDAVADRGAHAVIPPRRNATPRNTVTPGARVMVPGPMAVRPRRATKRSGRRDVRADLRDPRRSAAARSQARLGGP